MVSDRGGTEGGEGDRSGESEAAIDLAGYGNVETGERPIPRRFGLVRKEVTCVHLTFADGTEEVIIFTNPEHRGTYRRLDNVRDRRGQYVNGEQYHDHEVFWTTP